MCRPNVLRIGRTNGRLSFVKLRFLVGPEKFRIGDVIVQISVAGPCGSSNPKILLECSPRSRSFLKLMISHKNFDFKAIILQHIISVQRRNAIIGLTGDRDAIMLARR